MELAAGDRQQYVEKRDKIGKRRVRKSGLRRKCGFPTLPSIIYFFSMSQRYITKGKGFAVYKKASQRRHSRSFSAVIRADEDRFVFC
jgi:hypothetical protein